MSIKGVPKPSEQDDGEFYVIVGGYPTVINVQGEDIRIEEVVALALCQTDHPGPVAGWQMRDEEGHLLLFDQVLSYETGQRFFVNRTTGVGGDHIVAAAPEMLEALKMVRNKASSSIGRAVIQGMEMEKIWAAIAKAEGENQGDSNE